MTKVLEISRSVPDLRHGSVVGQLLDDLDVMLRSKEGVRLK